MDPFLGIASVINGLIREHDLQGWMKLLFSFVVSWFAVTTGTCGAALLAHSSWPVAIGVGLVSGFGTIVTLVRKSDKLKGMTFVWSNNVPADMTQYITDKK
jgi:uncharacterized membrane protein